MDVLKRIGLLLLAAVFAFIGFYFGFLRFLQEKDSGNVGYIVQDLVFILCGLIGVFACGRALVRMRKEKAVLIAAQPLPEVISAGLSVKSKIIAAILMFLTGACAYATFIYPPAFKATSILVGMTMLLGFGTYTYWIQYDRDGETLRLDKAGIKHIWYGRIPWAQVFGIYLQTMHVRGMAIHVLHLGVYDWKKYRMNMPRLMRLTSGSRTSLHMPLQPLNVDAVTIERLAVNLRSFYQPPMAHGWHYSMTESEFKAFSEEQERFQTLNQKLDEFNREFNSGVAMTDSKIAEENRIMEALLKENSDLVNKSLVSGSRKLNASSKHKILGGVLFLLIAAAFIYYFISYGLLLFDIYKEAGAVALGVVVLVLIVMAIIAYILNK